MEKLKIQGQEYIIYNISDFPYKSVAFFLNKKSNKIVTKSKNKVSYSKDFATFDTETTTIDTSAFDKKGKKVARGYGILYSWQYCIKTNNNYYICNGRTPLEFKYFLNELEKYFTTCNFKIVTFVHNFAFDFHFIKDVLNVSNVFAKEKRKIMKCNIENNYEFRCSYFLSNMSLAKFCESENVDVVKENKINYKKIRLPDTMLTDDEKIYNNADIISLHKCIEKLNISNDDTIKTMPLTSTGYVRRDFRKAMLKNEKIHKLIKECTPNLNLYNMLVQAFRGGNTVANRYKIGKKIKDVYSYDITSSYPYVLCAKYFPMSPFVKVSPEYLSEVLKKYCCLIKLRFTNLSTENVAPYIPFAKLTQFSDDTVNCNGRVLFSSECEMIITELDFKIIAETYNFDEVNIEELYISERGMLPIEFRQTVLDFYKKKTELKGIVGQEYFYNKAKNKLNSSFGMTVTSILNDEIIYDSGKWSIEKTDGEEAIEKYRNSKNSFLLYQWGVWCTAHARYRLQEGLNLLKCNSASSDFIYSDTDSIKFTNKNNCKLFENLNKDVLEYAQKNDLGAYNKNNEYLAMGVWDKEHDIEYFKTFGAKKYGCVINGDLIMTVSGCNKKLLAKYYENNIDNFKITGVNMENIGRTVACYNDLENSEDVEIKGKKYKNYSNIGIIDSTYKLTLSKDFLEVLEKIGYEL